MAKSDEERKAEQNKRKQKSREEAKAHDDACGAKMVQFKAYASTHSRITTLMEQFDFDTQAELITYLIHNVHDMTESDKFTKADFMAIPRPSRAD